MAREKREEKISMILNATVECALQYGLDAVQITQIADCAGMSARTINRYYPEKGVLLAEAVTKYLDDYYQNFIKLFNKIDKAGLNNREKLLLFLRVQLEHFEKMDALMTDALMIIELRFYQLCRNRVTPSSKLLGVEQVRNTVISFLEDGKKDGSIRTDLESDIASALISSSYNGMMQRIKSIQQINQKKEYREKDIKIFEDYIKMLEQYLMPVGEERRMPSA